VSKESKTSICYNGACKNKREREGHRLVAVCQVYGRVNGFNEICIYSNLSVGVGPCL